GPALVWGPAAARRGWLGRRAFDAKWGGSAPQKPAREGTRGAAGGREPRREMPAGEHLRGRERVAAVEQVGEDHAFQRLLVLGDDEVAQPLAHLGLDRLEPGGDLLLALAAHGKLGLELRIVRLEAELDGAVLEDIHVGQHVVGARFA